MHRILLPLLLVMTSGGASAQTNGIPDYIYDPVTAEIGRMVIDADVEQVYSMAGLQAADVVSAFFFGHAPDNPFADQDPGDRLEQAVAYARENSAGIASLLQSTGLKAHILDQRIASTGLDLANDGVPWAAADFEQRKITYGSATVKGLLVGAAYFAVSSTTFVQHPVASDLKRALSPENGSAASIEVLGSFIKHSIDLGAHHASSGGSGVRAELMVRGMIFNSLYGSYYYAQNFVFNHELGHLAFNDVSARDQSCVARALREDRADTFAAAAIVQDLTPEQLERLVSGQLPPSATGFEAFLLFGMPAALMTNSMTNGSECAYRSPRDRAKFIRDREIAFAHVRWAAFAKLKAIWSARPPAVLEFEPGEANEVQREAFKARWRRTCRALPISELDPVYETKLQYRDWLKDRVVERWVIVGSCKTVPPDLHTLSHRDRALITARHLRRFEAMFDENDGTLSQAISPGQLRR